MKSFLSKVRSHSVIKSRCLLVFQYVTLNRVSINFLSNRWIRRSVKPDLQCNKSHWRKCYNKGLWDNRRRYYLVNFNERWVERAITRLWNSTTINKHTSYTVCQLELRSWVFFERANNRNSGLVSIGRRKRKLWHHLRRRLVTKGNHFPILNKRLRG